jgi:hypothetical protein
MISDTNPDNDLALKTDFPTGIDTRGDPQLSISNPTVDDNNGNILSSKSIMATDKPWSPARMHGRRQRKIHRPERRPLIIETSNMFTVLKEEEFVVLEPTSNSGLPTNDERIFLALNKKINIERKNISKLRNGSLLIRTHTKTQSQELKKLNTIMNCSVEIKSHPTLNQTQGTIFAPDLMHLSSEELTEDWTNQGHKIKKVYRFQRKEDGIFKLTPKLLITFDGLNLPETIWHGFRRYSTQIFIPNPMRCFKCNKIDHTGKNYRSQFDTCVICSGEKHQLPCNNTPKCVNCSENHPANSPNCIIYKIAKETITIKTQEKCSYREAKQRAEEKFTTVSFAQTIRNKPPVAIQQITPHPAHPRGTSDKIEIAKPSLTDNQKQGNKRPTFTENSTDDEPERQVKMPKRAVHDDNANPVIVTVEAEIHHRNASQPITVFATPLRKTKPVAVGLDPIEMELEVLDGTPIRREKETSKSMVTSQVSLNSSHVTSPLVRSRSLIKDFPMPPHFSTSSSEGKKRGTKLLPDPPGPKIKKDVKQKYKLGTLKTSYTREDFLKPKLLSKSPDKPKIHVKETFLQLFQGRNCLYFNF